MAKKKTKDEIKELLETAREFGCLSIKIDGVEYDVSGPKPAAPKEPPITAKDLLEQLPAIEGEYTYDEILYYSCPYGMELEAAKIAEAEKAAKGK